MNEQALWPDETDHSEQTRERERLQEDIQTAFNNLMADMTPYARRASETDIKLLKWALGVK